MPSLLFNGRMAVGLALYGVSVIQYRFYIVAFPKDKHIVKIAKVFLVLGLGPQLSGHCQYARVFMPLLSNVDSLPMERDLSFHEPDDLVAFASNLVAALIQLGEPLRQISVWWSYVLHIPSLGVNSVTSLPSNFQVTLKDAYDSNNIATYFSNPDSAANALASALCDAIITASIYFCLRRSQNGLGLWQENSIQKLTFVFVQMGLITFVLELYVSCVERKEMYPRSATICSGVPVGASYPTNSTLTFQHAPCILPSVLQPMRILLELKMPRHFWG
ncbi:hypothetical protein EDD17DRAFT_1510548 [Pisolithus thermaeus]|nr:hypothetical protein EDD17DRAFT_1510548 [Pisolithus thermaeus]